MPPSPTEPGPLGASWIATANALPIVVWTGRPDGSVEFANERWFEMTGLSPEAVAGGQGWADIVHPADLERAAAAYDAAISGGTPFRADLRVRRADGSYQWVRSQAEPQRDEAGTVVRWFGVVLDVEESHRAGEDFQALAEAVPVIVWSAEPGGSIDWYSPRWYEYTGQTPEEALGWGWQAVPHPDDFLELMRKWPESLATGTPFEMEYRMRRHDGVFHWFLTRIEPVRDDLGNVVRWYGSNVDIDAQKTALDRTKRVAQTLQEIFLPKTLPQKPALRMDAVYLPAERDALIGGDWFDAFEAPDGSIVFSIGDVAGHGLEASVILGRLRQAIFTLAFQGSDPAATLEELDRILRHQDPDTIVTALVGFVDLHRAEMTYASAGHPAPMIALRNDTLARILPGGGLPLGTGFALDLHTHRVPIEPDAVVAVYTDGMLEFSRDILGTETKLRAAVALMVGNTRIARPAVAVQELVFDEMPTVDDAALLLMQFSSVSTETGVPDAPVERTWRFHSSDAHTAHTSRQEIAAYLRAMTVDDEQLFLAELIVGEILANTVEHAPGLVEIHLDWTREKPIITVRDTGPGLRAIDADLPVDTLAENGRGLFLIGTLAEATTVTRMRSTRRAIQRTRCVRGSSSPSTPSSSHPRPEAAAGRPSRSEQRARVTPR